VPWAYHGAMWMVFPLKLVEEVDSSLSPSTSWKSRPIQTGIWKFLTLGHSLVPVLESHIFCSTPLRPFRGNFECFLKHYPGLFLSTMRSLGWPGVFFFFFFCGSVFSPSSARFGGITYRPLLSLATSMSVACGVARRFRLDLGFQKTSAYMEHTQRRQIPPLFSLPFFVRHDFSPIFFFFPPSRPYSCRSRRLASRSFGGSFFPPPPPLESRCEVSPPWLCVLMAGRSFVLLGNLLNCPKLNLFFFPVFPRRCDVPA